MKCSGVRHLLSAYLDGELDRGEELMVGQHLRRCHACADEVNALRQTIALCASLDDVEVPAGFRADLRARLVALGPPTVVAVPVRPLVPAWRRKAARWALPAAAAAAFAVAVGIGPYMADQVAPPERPTVQSEGTPAGTSGPQSVPSSESAPPVAAEKPPTTANGPRINQPSASVNNQPSTVVAAPAKEVVSTSNNPQTVVNPSTGTAQTATEANADVGTVSVTPQYALSTAIRLSVKDMTAALSNLKSLASKFGGAVAEGTGTFEKATGSYKGILVSVPSDQLEAFLAELSEAGVVLSGGTVARHDYGAEIAQTSATLAEANKELQGVKGNDTSANAHRDSLRERIASLEEQLTALQTKVAIATVELTFEESRQSSLLH